MTESKGTTFTTDLDASGILTLVWDMPDRSMNVLNEASMTEFAGLVTAALENDDVKGIVITSGKKHFAAGADLGMLGGSGSGAAPSPRELARSLYERSLELNMLLRRLETGGKPVAAAIPGTALGGGLEICLACHYRVAADNPKAQLGLPEAKVGVMPGGGGTQRLPRMIGAMASLPLMLQGTTLDPQAAAAQGLIHKVVPSDELLAEAKRWILEEGKSTQPWDQSGYKIPGGGPYHPQGAPIFMMGSAMLRKQSYGNYPAQKAILQAVYEGLQVPIEAGLRIEARLFTSLLLDPTARNMIRSLFLSMQELDKGARRPQGIEPTDCRKLGVLGAGFMGAGVAYVSAYAGIDVVLIDISQENADRGKKHAEELIDQRMLKGKMTAEQRTDILGRITPTTDYSELEGCDLVIEAVFEDRAIKAVVTEKAEAVIDESAVFGSNTSTLPITGLAEASKRPENFIGVHFFSPVHKMKLVELILGEKTSDRALAVAMDYVGKIRKTAIVVNDSRGFYTSRCFGTYVQEGLAMLAEGVPPATIENVGRMTGMPVSPLAMSDEVAIDLAYHIQQQTKKDLGERWVDTPASKVIEAMVEVYDRRGRKNRKGFYDYPEEGKKRLWDGLTDMVREVTGTEQQSDPPAVDVLRRRLLYIQALETARCFEEKVVTDVRDADVGAILGWGFAPWSGGPLSLIDTVGAARFVEQCEQLAEQFGDRFRPNDLLREMAANHETFYGRFNPQREAAA